MNSNDQFQLHAARAFFASAWADAVEENGATLRGEIMDQLPDAIDSAAIQKHNLQGATIANRVLIEQTPRSSTPDLAEFRAKLRGIE